jgi:hypothetical protein
MLTYDAAADLNVLTPGYEVQGSKIHIKLNSLGFRGKEFAREKPPGVIRIVCLGASTTFGAEASSNNAVWPARLEDALQSAYPDVRFEVINARVPGYVSTDNLKSLRHRIMPLSPDLVIYYEANNEIVRDTRELALGQGIIDSEAQTSPTVRWLSHYSLLFDLAHKNVAIITRGRMPSGPKIDHIPVELPTRFVGVLEQMRAELAARDVPFLLSTFVVKYRHSQDPATQVRNADVAFYYMPWMSIEGMLHAVDVYNQAILDYGARVAVPVVDDREMIPADEAHFVDCMHLADGGHELMAQRFYRYLTESGIVRRLITKAAEKAHGRLAVVGSVS